MKSLSIYCSKVSSALTSCLLRFTCIVYNYIFHILFVILSIGTCIPFDKKIINHQPVFISEVSCRLTAYSYIDVRKTILLECYVTMPP